MYGRYKRDGFKIAYNDLALSLSGKNFEETCKKLSSKMDDVASGAVIGE